jgi:hypothetical protein
MKHVGSILGVAGLLVAMGASSPVKAKKALSLAYLIEREINRIRTSPGRVASELKGQKDALIAARVKVGDSKEDATKAIESCILDLETIATKYRRLDEINLSSTFTSITQSFADQLAPTKQASEFAIRTRLKIKGYGLLDSRFEEILLNLPNQGTDAEKAKEIVQNLLINWGASGISSGYMYRCFILDYLLVSTTPQPSSYRVSAMGIGIKGESVRIQYSLRRR